MRSFKPALFCIFIVLSLTIHQTSISLAPRPNPFPNTYNIEYRADQVPNRWNLALQDLYRGRGLNYVQSLADKLKKNDNLVSISAEPLSTTLRLGLEKMNPRYDAETLKQVIRQLIANGVDKNEIIEVARRIIDYYNRSGYSAHSPIRFAQIIMDAAKAA